MMKRWSSIILIFACHVAAFTAIYFGRVNRVAICMSDLILLAVPFGVAATAYAVALFRASAAKEVWKRRLVATFGGVFLGLLSESVGMLIAFNSWGI